MYAQCLSRLRVNGRCNSIHSAVGITSITCWPLIFLCLRFTTCSETNLQQPFRVVTLKRNTFQFIHASHHLRRLYIDDLMKPHEDLSSDRILLILRSVLPMDNLMVVGCVGALLTELLKSNRLRYTLANGASNGTEVD